MKKYIITIMTTLIFVACAHSQDDLKDWSPTPEPRKPVADKTPNPAKPSTSIISNKTGVTAGGVKYEIIREGTGSLPLPTDTLICHYEGRLLNGKVFDSSYSRNTPFSFKMNQVIKGWGEALMIMPIGSKWKITIPPDLAYGARGAGKVIGPNETLVFTIELLGVK